MAGVVGIHVLANSLHLGHPPGTTGAAVLAADRVLNDVCVPAFLFLSGTLVWTRPAGASARAWWTRRAEVVFVPYLAWSAVYFVLALRADAALRAAAPAAIAAAFAVRLLTGTAHYHLYFPPILLLAYALTPAANRLLRHSPLLLVTAALACQGALVVVYRMAPLPPEPRLMLANALTLIPFAAFGAAVAASAERLGAHPGPVAAAAAAGGVALVAHGLGWLPVAADPGAGYLGRAAIMLATAAVLAAAVVLPATSLTLTAWAERFRAPLRGAAPLSYGVYLAHPLLLESVRSAVRSPAAWASPAFLAALWAGVLAASLAGVALLARFRATSWLV